MIDLGQRVVILIIAIGGCDDAGGVIGVEGQQIIRDTLSIGCGPEDRLLLGFEDGQ